jgi:hypothetical protein
MLWTREFAEYLSHQGRALAARALTVVDDADEQFFSVVRSREALLVALRRIARRDVEGRPTE